MNKMTRKDMDDECSIHHENCPGCMAKLEAEDWTDKNGMCEYCSKEAPKF